MPYKEGSLAATEIAFSSSSTFPIRKTDFEKRKLKIIVAVSEKHYAYLPVNDVAVGKEFLSETGLLGAGNGDVFPLMKSGLQLINLITDKKQLN